MSEVFGQRLCRKCGQPCTADEWVHPECKESLPKPTPATGGEVVAAQAWKWMFPGMMLANPGDEKWQVLYVTADDYQRLASDLDAMREERESFRFDCIEKSAAIAQLVEANDALRARLEQVEGENRKLLEAVRENHQWHLDYDGYQDSALCQINTAALAAAPASNDGGGV